MSRKKRKTKKEKEIEYFKKLGSCFDEYKKIIIIEVDFVSAKQISELRKFLQEKAVILMGKNTKMKKVLKEKMKQNKKLSKLLPEIQGNCGLVFVKEGNLNKTFKIIQKAQKQQEKLKKEEKEKEEEEEEEEKETEKENTNEKTENQEKEQEEEETKGLKIKRVYNEGSIFHPSLLETTKEDMQQLLMDCVTNIQVLNTQYKFRSIMSNAIETVLAVKIGLGLKPTLVEEC
ncbi:60S ACIDIC ribosomal protein P0 [Anaeramoeba flamelloides]|uniref:60S ACIDIC ribosomal protein P0 n=1 Tax=Anaeramoeba flamelloides TaxID=1746091 RepID=A0ABQ8XF78_9EUKA|nr:60S ACIDIC ribosomal protein P0 [Anaeramoeba flamelloides]